MPKCIRRTCIGKKCPVSILCSFGSDNDTVAFFSDRFFYFLQKFLFIKGNFRKENDMRGVAIFFLGQRSCCGNPSSVATHHFQDKNPGGSFTHGGDIQCCLFGGYGNILGNRTETWAVICEG